MEVIKARSNKLLSNAGLRSRKNILDNVHSTVFAFILNIEKLARGSKNDQFMLRNHLGTV
jgi:hypothetical protein